MTSSDIRTYLIYLATVFAVSTTTLYLANLLQHNLTSLTLTVFGLPLIICITFGKFTWEVFRIEAGIIGCAMLWFTYFGFLFIPLLVWLRTSKRRQLAFLALFVSGHAVTGFSLSI